MSIVQSQNQATSYFVQKVSSRRKKMWKFNGSMTISTILGRKVKRRGKVKRKAKKEKVRKRRKEGKRKRRSQNTGRNPNAFDVIGIPCFFFNFCYVWKLHL